MMGFWNELKDQMKTKLHISKVAFKDPWLGIGKGRIQKLMWPQLKGLKMWVSLAIMGNKQDEKLIAITHNTQIWAMTNKGPLKILH